MLKNLFGLAGQSQTATAPEPVKTTPAPEPVKTSKAPKSVRKTKSSKSAKKTKAPAFVPAEVKEKTLVEKYRDGFADNASILFHNDSASPENADLVIKAAYKQIFGNAHLMDSERSPEAESQMRFGQITVRDFVRQLAMSDRYRTLFWEKYSTPVFIELNFKHLLGRAPGNYHEIAEYMKILAGYGFEAVIDSFIDSEEYTQNFGDFSVPYFRGYSTQTGRNPVGFANSFSLTGVPCSSDKSLYNDLSPKLQGNLIESKSSSVPSIRPIPKSYPDDFVVGRERHVPLEYKAMAMEVLRNLRNNSDFILNNPNYR